MAARQGLSQKKTQAGSPDMFWKLKQRLRTEQEEQAYGLRTQSISSCNLNYTELFLPLIITSLLQQESKHALLKTAFWLQARHRKAGRPGSRTWCCHFKERGKESSDKQGRFQHGKVQLRRGLFIMALHSSSRINACLCDPYSKCYSIAAIPYQPIWPQSQKEQQKGDDKRWKLMKDIAQPATA